MGWLSKTWKKVKKSPITKAAITAAAAYFGAPYVASALGTSTAVGGTLASLGASSAASAAGIGESAWEGGGGPVTGPATSWEGGGGPVVADALPPTVPAFVGSPGPGSAPSSASQVIDIIGKGLGSGLGQIPAAAVGALGQAYTNRQQVEAAREQMDFQREMGTTGYQRAVGDMRAAGLNPMLAYSQGPEAGGSGAQPQLGNVAASALQAMQMEQGIRNAKAEETRTYAEADRTIADTELMQDRGALLKAQTSQTAMSEREAFARIRKLAHEVEILGVEIEKAEGTAQAYIAERKAQALMAEAQAIISGAGVAEAKAMEAFWKSSVGTLAPFGRAAGKLLSSAGGVARLLGVGR